MKRKLLTLINLFVVFILPATAGKIATSARQEMATREVVQSNSANDIQINEVMFYPDTTGYEWVELKNSASVSIDIGGYALTDEDGNWYQFPDSLPSVPSGAFVVIIFDGLGRSSDDLDFGDNKATLHSQEGLVDIFENDADQVALYSGMPIPPVFLPIIIGGEVTSDAVQRVEENTVKRSPSNKVSSKPEILSFIAWGSAPQQDAHNAASAGIWDPNWAVSVVRSTGFAGVSSLPGEPIGLLIQSQYNSPDNWFLYQGFEASPGLPNLVPSVAISNIVPGTVMESSMFAMGWNDVQGSTGYHFQLDDSEDFTSPYTDTILTRPAFASDEIIPDGEYYWRVKVLSAEGESAWSASMPVESVSFPESPSQLRERSLSPDMPEAAFIKVLPIDWQLQHKDTRMLYLDGMPEFGQMRWDSAHEDDGDWIVGNGTPVRAHPLDHNYCVRASLAMLASFYGGDLSQDRISFEMFHNIGPDGPEGDLGYPWLLPDGQQLFDTANWILNGPKVQSNNGKPTFNQIKSWIDGDRPIVANATLPGGVLHVRIIGGYAEFHETDGTTQYWLYLLDPYDRSGPKAITYESDTTFHVWVGPSGSNGAPDVLSDEDEDNDNIYDMIDDSDSDGIVDFDERYRFPGLSHTNPDSDGDGVLGKKDVRGYVFDNGGQYRWLRRDVDGDGLRKEADIDNDNGGYSDGCEDSNLNGIYEPELGETNNFDATEEKQCAPPPPDEFVELTWERSSESDTFDCASVGSCVEEGLQLPVYPGDVWDNGTYTPSDNIDAIPPGYIWASWPQTYSVDVRHFRGIFTFPSGLNPSTAEGILFDPFYDTDIVPINDNIYIYVNGEYQFGGGTNYGAPNGGFNGTSAIANETDGWYIPESIILRNFQPGSNTIDIVLEERARWGGVGYLVLRFGPRETSTSRISTHK